MLRLSACAALALAAAAAGTGAPPPAAPGPAAPAVAMAAPAAAAYSAVATRANGARPILSSRDAGSGAGWHTARSTFAFNFNPTLLTLPDGTQALLVRSSNGTNASTASTIANPDYLTLTKIRRTGAGAVVVDDITDASIVLSPEPSKIENRGVQDPRVMRDPLTGTYWLAYSSYGDAGVGLGIARSTDGYKWQTVTHCAGEADGCGKSGTIMFHTATHHLMFWGPGSVNVAVSSDYMNWTTLNSSAVFGRKNWLTGGAPSDPGRGPWAEPGPTPQRLSDGNYFFVVIEAGVPTGHAPCPRTDPGGQKGEYWGAGWVILDGKDPTKILQHNTRLLFATTEWEVNSTTSTTGGEWEMHVCCIGATNAIAPVPGEKDTFMVYYGAGDSVTGAAKVVVKVPVLKHDDDATFSALDPNVQLLNGRFAKNASTGTVRTDWTGATITVAVSGTASVALNVTGSSQWTVSVDGTVTLVVQSASPQPQLTVIASGLSKTAAHTVSAMKMMEALCGPVTLSGVVLDAGGKLLPAPSPPERRLAFLGDSITCGYGAMGVAPCSGYSCGAPVDAAKNISNWESGYDSYGAILGRRFKADSQIVCVSGAGFAHAWKTSPVDQTGMVARFGQVLGSQPNVPSNGIDPAWVPDAVVVNIVSTGSQPATDGDWLLLTTTRAAADALGNERRGCAAREHERNLGADVPEFP